MKKNILWLIIILLAGVVIGYLWASRRPLAKIPLVNNRPATPTNDQAAAPAIHNLLGLVAEVKSNGLLLVVTSTLAGRPTNQEKLAKVNRDTAIYLLSKKTDQELWGAAYQEISAKQSELKQAGQKRDAVLARRLVNELRQLYAKVSEEQAAKTSELQAKLDALAPGQTAERQELSRQIAEINSAFNYRLVGLKEVKAGDEAVAWSKDDLAATNSFLAEKIEISR